jgi:hypothetical protein
LLLTAARSYSVQDPSTEPGNLLDTLAGKQPLIRRSFRPPNFETPPADLRAAFTPNDRFFVR